MSGTHQIAIVPKLLEVFDGQPADVRGAYGGRGSGKTRSFATMIAAYGMAFGLGGVSGQLLCARQFMNSLDDSSLEECKRAIQDDPVLSDYYEVGDKFIRSKDGRIWFAFAGLDRNIASIKSKGRILICWVDEAEPVTDEAWQTLIPTLREEGEGWNAELWVTWNPKRKTSPVEKRFRFSTDPLVKVVQCNWRDNPKFPAKLERDRQRDLEENPDQYDHIWEGGYAETIVGAYYAKSITKAREERRIGRVGPDELITYRAFCDLGGTGQKADAFTIWVAQFIGREVRVLKYYEAVGQPASAHMTWLRENGYHGGNTTVWLPHDGDKQDAVFDVSYRKAFEAAGYPVEVVPNQGKGAAMSRVKSVQRVFPSIYMDEEGCAGGIEALGWYHEKRDEVRGIGLGPDHDWSSHGCLVAGTLIDTSIGHMPIERVSIGDYVQTPAGLSKVLNAGMTKISTELIEVTTTDGTVLTLTPEHKVFTTRGVVEADTLSYNELLFTQEDAPCFTYHQIKSMGYRAAFIENSGAKGIGFGKLAASMDRKLEAFKGFCTLRFTAPFMGSLKSGQKSPWLTAICATPALTTGSSSGKSDDESILCRSWMGFASIGSQRATTKQTTPDMAASPCIGMYGSSITAKSLMECMSTIRMETRATTPSKIWNCCRPLTIRRTTAVQTLGLAVLQTRNSLSRLASWLVSGTQAVKVWSGTKRMAFMLGKSVFGILQRASTAAQATKHHTQPSPNTAKRVAKLRRIELEVPVYDLTVEHHHCYFANGVLVSNCDSFGLMCVVYESVGQSNPNVKPIKYKSGRFIA